MPEPSICPVCGTPNADDWPLVIGDDVLTGGCQACWEDACTLAWWKVMARDRRRRLAELFARIFD